MLKTHVKHAHSATVPVTISQRAPFSLTETIQTVTRAVGEHCSSPASTDSVTSAPAKCAPVELPLNNASVWPQRRAVAFSVSLWLRVNSDIAAHSHHSLSSLSTTDVNLSAAGAL